jgi:DNA-binding NarL/FixJ family response regulator
MTSNFDPPPSDAMEQTADAARVLAAAGVEVPEGADRIPLFNAEAVAAALVGRDGHVVCASPAFVAMGGEGRIDGELLARAALGGAPRTAVVDLTAEDGTPDSAIWAYARAAQAAGWRLPPQLRAAAQAHPDHVVILTSRFGGVRPLEAACHTYGLSGLQTRVALEAIRTGSAKAAARRLGIAHDTARQALAEAMKRTRAPRLPALVARLTALAFGVLPEADSAEILGDLWGLTPRQAAIAGLIADGLTRAAAATALGVSEAVIKKELDRVYLLLQVSAGAALARKLVEAKALNWLTLATGGDIGFVDTSAEPLQFVLRPSGGRIAVSDYGPASGRPVLVVHSSMTTRIVGRGLLRALQAGGYRPLSIDRPGFGLSDEWPGARAGAHDPNATAAQDAIAVLDHLKLRTVDVAARGGAHFVLALGRAAPERLGRVVLVNPDPHLASSARRVGAFGIFKAANLRNPGQIRFSIAMMARQLTLERVAGMMHRQMGASPPDAEAMKNPEIVLDYFRAQRTFATGRIGGCVNEQTEFARGSQPPPWSGAGDWRVLVAAHDTLHDPGHTLAYWRHVLPDARFRLVPDTGRLLALSHPHHVVEALAAP